MKDRFGFPETTADRYLREEQERARPYRDMLGGGTVAEAIREASERHRLFSDLDALRPYRSVLDVLERERRDHERFRQLTSTAWAQSISETARSIVERDRSLLAEERRLAGTMLETVRAFEKSRSTVADAIREATAGGTFRQMLAEALPRFTGFSTVAQEMRLLDAMTLRASEGVTTSATALAAEMVLETQRIVTAIAEASSNEESSALQVQLVDILLQLLPRLGPNTLSELRTMGLLGWSGWIAGIMGLLLAVVALQPSQSAEEKAAFAALHQQVEALSQETHAYRAAASRADEAFVADLPRAELLRPATFRRTPERSGAVVLKAPVGMPLALQQRRGAWRLVVYRDPLTDQLARGWVYGKAVTPLAPAVEEGGP